MTTKTKTILAAPLFPAWMALILLLISISLVIETVAWIKFWVWPEIIFPLFSEQWDNFRYRIGVVSYEDIREPYHWELIDPKSRFYDPEESQKRTRQNEKFSTQLQRDCAATELADAWIAAKEKGIDAFWGKIYRLKQQKQNTQNQKQ